MSHENGNVTRAGLSITCLIFLPYAFHSRFHFVYVEVSEQGHGEFRDFDV
jgi:hypothetical protein